VWASPTFLRWDGRPEGASNIFSLMVGSPELFTTADQTRSASLVSDAPWTSVDRDVALDPPGG